MITASELSSALFGAWRLARHDPRGQDHFDDSITGFWRSFQAAVIVAPGYMLLILPIFGHADITAGPLRFLVVHLLAYIISWTAFPLVMVGVARRLSRNQDYLRYIIAYNWANVLQMAVLLPALLLVQIGLPGAPLLNLAAMVAIYFYYWFVARTVLSISTAQAIGVVMVNFTFDFIIGIVANAMVVGGPAGGAG